MTRETFWNLITLMLLVAGLFCAFNGGYAAGAILIAGGAAIGLFNSYIEEIRFRFNVTVIRKQRK
ncbi:hypothetical protein LU11_gp289 [Pseudomonas phage Lu11]|uniref:hypothetical protein n=1 Tax=Pseudomonas phage Lu11 TaxID=1161927 RepID=UPI00025F1848|nr:hypothetical protein LU11_gp289 [Pseudomonas phage Lu11]AFH14820.1 hypothetical protein Lu11_0282 [Pseudomonas phage Lu11]